MKKNVHHITNLWKICYFNMSFKLFIFLSTKIVRKCYIGRGPKKSLYLKKAVEKIEEEEEEFIYKIRRNSDQKNKGYLSINKIEL